MLTKVGETLEVWRCEFCKGPAVWTLGVADQVYYHCQLPCEGFLEGLTADDDSVTVDKVASVSASEDRGRSHVLNEPMSSSHPEDVMNHNSFKRAPLPEPKPEGLH